MHESGIQLRSKNRTGIAENRKGLRRQSFHSIFSDALKARRMHLLCLWYTQAVSQWETGIRAATARVHQNPSPPFFL